jgi:predicted dehydrogenase
MSVKLGVIGCGAISQRRHLPEAAGHAGVRIVAVSDPNESRVKEMGIKYSATAFTDHKQMLKSADLDAVVVAGPNALHASQAIDALRAGKHVLVEKPMAGSKKEALAMIAEAKKAKKFLMVGQNQRLMPPHVKAKEILDSGRLGKVLSFKTSFQHPGPDGWSLDGAKSWFFKQDMAIMGVCGDLGVHKVDLMRYLLGQEFTEVSGFLGTLDKKDSAGKPIAVDDNAYMTLKTAEGVIGTMTISWTNYSSTEDNYTKIYCEKGGLFIGADPQFPVAVHMRTGEKEFYKTGAMATNTQQTKSGIMDMFIASIASKKSPAIDGNEGYKSLAVILTCIEAAKGAKVLKVKY